MKIILSDIGKRYHRWIFQGIDYQFKENQRYGIGGSNGSGKSTLIAIISGYRTPTTGTVNFLDHLGGKISLDQIHHHLSLAAPYVNLIGEFSVSEQLTFHAQFKRFQDDIDQASFLELSELEMYQNVQVSHLSSGLQQRLKLSLALLSDTAVLILDEPTSYLDQRAKAWFSQLYQKYSEGRMVILASNAQDDLNLTNQILQMNNFQESRKLRKEIL